VSVKNGVWVGSIVILADGSVNDGVTVSIISGWLEQAPVSSTTVKTITLAG
jgi:hypothetical protein